MRSIAVSLHLIFLTVQAFAQISAQSQSGASAPVGAAEAAVLPSARVHQPPAPKPGPKISGEAMEAFLRTAPIVSIATLQTGTTASSKAVLSDDRLTHDVHVQCVDVFRKEWKGAEGTVEKNFRDSWKFNVAAYRLAKLLGIGTVPMSVERVLDGKPCSFTWWVDDVWLVEAERRDKNIKPPTSDAWVNQLNTVRVFDQLIHNSDRNQGNLLITPEWKVWMIDHTRAFRVSHDLPNPDSLRRIDQALLNRLRELNTIQLKKELGPWLRAEEIAAVLARRDKLVSFFEGKIREEGEDAVLTGIPRKTPHVVIP